MSLICRSCFYDNPGGTGFCLRCGQALAPGTTQSMLYGSSQAGATGSQIQQQMYPPHSSSTAPGYQPGYQPAVGARPASSMGSLRRAFAGHGTLIRHHSWLLEGKQAQIANVRQTILEKVVGRNLDRVQTSQANLTDQGFIEEYRDYIKTRRKSTTVFIYVTEAGNDLYISRATTVQPGLSMLRVVILILGVLGIIVPYIGCYVSYVSIISNIAGGPGAVGSLGLLFWILMLLAFSLPLSWIFIFVLSRSIASQIFDGDFLVLLRPNTLTEFQRDEVALMEHMTDNVVQEAVKQLGLDASKITPPPNGYQPKERIRLI